MAVTNSGMTLYTNNDNESGWGGTDDPDDYNNAIQGTNSESWQVSKNSTETATLTKSADMGSAKYFNFYMSSNLAPYYTDVKAELRTNSSNYEQFQIATTTYRKVSGDFHPIVMQFGEGTETGALNKGSISDMRIIVDNSSSGNIRSVINNWIDTMWYGIGRTITGTTVNDELFLESHNIDTTTNDRFDGCSELYKGSLAYQTDVYIDTTTGNSFGETVAFAGGYNTDDLYTIDVIDTADFRGTNIIGVDGAYVGIYVNSADATISMVGGSLINGRKINIGVVGCSFEGVVFASCEELRPSLAVFKDCTISDTREATTGALFLQNSSYLDNWSNIVFNNYTGKYALYIHASITGTITLDNFQGDGSGTDVYWAGTSGTLIVNKSNGTNFSTWSSAGGTVEFASDPVTTLITVKDISTGIEIENARVFLAAGSGGPLTEGEIIFNELSDVNGQVSDERTLLSDQPVVGRVRMSTSSPLYKTVPINEVISNTNGLTLNVSMIRDD